MCLNPVTIVNPSKYINLSRQDRYLLQVPCGHCAECQSTLSNQWLFRTYQEFKDCLNSGGFVYFDSLTYDKQSLPSIKSVFPDFIRDYPIFDSKHTHLFLDALDKRLERKYNTQFRYFLSSEYGEKKGRPHYHILLFVYGNITPVQLSVEVASLWKYGRTDGYPYKSKNYVTLHNTITENNPQTLLRTSNYVTKYVQKSCKYDKMVDSRLNELLDWYGFRLELSNSIEHKDNFLTSSHAKVVRSMLKRRMAQFHRQSQQFGASYLAELDLNQIAKDGVLFMPHHKYVTMAIPLPVYYKRKLFQEQIKVDGVRMWHNTEVGIWYNEQRKTATKQLIYDRYLSAARQYNIGFCEEIADYIIDKRGRIKGHLPPSENMFERLEQVDLYNYSSRSDIIRFDKPFLRTKFCGNSTCGYTKKMRGIALKTNDFVGKFVLMDSDLEKIIDDYNSSVKDFNKRKQRAFALKQHLTDVHKNIC